MTDFKGKKKGESSSPECKVIFESFLSDTAHVLTNSLPLFPWKDDKEISR